MGINSSYTNSTVVTFVMEMCLVFFAGISLFRAPYKAFMQHAAVFLSACTVELNDYGTGTPYRGTGIEENEYQYHT